jgi:uncharacterized protein
VHGYYVLPFLHQERLLARVDLRSERAQGRLAVHAVHLEAAWPSEDALPALAGALRALALHCRSQPAQRLRGALLET